MAEVTPLRNDKAAAEATEAKQLTNPQEILKFHKPFITDERVENIEVFPCTDCHDNDEQKSNPTVRSMSEDHETIKLVHGEGRFWCLTCHDDKNRDKLRSLEKQPISFNQSYLLCGQCHQGEQNDFFNGVHGKRKGGWQGERRLTNCTECHNPHVPQLQPRKPVPPPIVEERLKQRVAKDIHPFKQPWEK